MGLGGRQRQQQRVGLTVGLRCMRRSTTLQRRQARASVCTVSARCRAVAGSQQPGAASCERRWHSPAGDEQQRRAGSGAERRSTTLYSRCRSRCMHAAGIKSVTLGASALQEQVKAGSGVRGCLVCWCHRSRQGLARRLRARPPQAGGSSGARGGRAVWCCWCALLALASGRRQAGQSAAVKAC